jgi:hypothetical protein
MSFEDKVRQFLKHKKPEDLEKEGLEGVADSYKRKNLISIIERKVGPLNSLNLEKADVRDLFRLADALTKYGK